MNYHLLPSALQHSSKYKDNCWFTSWDIYIIWPSHRELFRWSTSEMPGFTQIRSVHVSHSLYNILKSSKSWQWRLTATNRHHANTHLKLQKIKMCSVNEEKKMISHCSTVHFMHNRPIYFSAPESHCAVLNELVWSGTITCSHTTTAAGSVSQEIKLWPQHTGENNMLILCLLNGWLSTLKEGKTLTLFRCTARWSENKT